MDQSTLEEMFIEQAEWREGKAAQFPSDSRNAEAAKIFRHLATTSKDVPDEVIAASEELYEDAPDSECWNEMIRVVGFYSFPASAESLLRAFIASRTS